MKKYLIPVTLSFLSASAWAGGKWNAGVALGFGTTQSQERLKVSYPGIASNDYKFKLKQSGPVAGVTVGYSLIKGKNVFGLNLGGYRDWYTGTNNGDKQALNRDPDFTLTAKNDLKRKYTMELAGKVGRLVALDTQVYGKLGVLQSQFREQYSAGDSVAKANMSGWGGVVGLGIQKDYESVNLGVEYNYNFYEKIGKTVYYNPGLDKNVSKIRPQYHSVLLTISKSF